MKETLKDDRVYLPGAVVFLSNKNVWFVVSAQRTNSKACPLVGSVFMLDRDAFALTRAYLSACYGDTCVSQECITCAKDITTP